MTLVKGPGGKLAVKDVQGNVAGVVSGPVKVGKVSVFVIDRVLMSGECSVRILAHVLGLHSRRVQCMQWSYVLVFALGFHLPFPCM